MNFDVFFYKHETGTEKYGNLQEISVIGATVEVSALLVDDGDFLT